MKLDESTWKAVIDVALANLDRQNQHFKEEAPYNRLTLDVMNTESGKFQFVITKLVTDYSGGSGRGRIQQYRVVARELATGELYKGKPHKDKAGIWYGMMTERGAKAWDKLAGKSPAEIVDGLKLTDFGPVFVGGSGASPSTPITTKVSA